MAGMAVAMAIMAVLLSITPIAHAKSTDNLRQDTTVDAGHFGEIKTAFVTNKTRAFLSCESGDMVVTIDFNDPFYGVVYANRDPLSPCKVHGDGSKIVTIKLPLYGCGTREEQKRTFINDIVVRFREGLIVDEDEVKTIICRYGPPVAPIPAPLPIVPLPLDTASVVAKPKRLSEAEIYVIVCVLLFLALLLLGVGLAYYCLKRRNIKVVRKRRLAPSGPPSEITKLSSTLSAFDGFRIPRAAAHSVSGSEAALLTAGDHSDTVPSDYPSESPSSAVSEADVDAERYVYESRDVRDDIFTISGTELAERSLTTIYEHERDLEEERRRRSIGGAAAAPPVYARIRKRQAELALLEEQDHVIPRAHTSSPDVATARRHTIDDRYVTTVTETHSHEDITKLTRETTDTMVREEPRWDVLIRAFPPEARDGEDDRSTTGTESSVPDAVENAWEQLSYVSERTGEPIWRLVTTDETLRARLREARTVEEVETLRSDTRYQRLMQPKHWDVVIRILAAPEFERAPSESESSVAASEISVPRSAASLGSYYSKGARRRSDWDARSRRSSLPPVAEDDRLSAFDDDDEGWPRARGPPTASVAERSTTEIVEGLGDYYESRPRLLRSVSGTEARHYDEDDDVDERVWREASSYRHEQRGYGMQRLEGSSAEIILDSPLVAMMQQQGRGHASAIDTAQQSDWLMR